MPMTLDEQYQKTIDDQRTHLMELQSNFNTACDAAKARAEEKMKAVSKDDKEAKEAILQEQKADLDEALQVLKGEVDHSTKETMRRLEAIVHEKEKKILSDLEQKLNNL